MIWALEPDFYQYASTKNNNNKPLSFSDAAKLIGDIADAIKAQMPNAQISMDISPWAPENWFTSLPLSKFTYMHTSGGVSQPDNSIKSGEMSWAKVKQLTGLPIIADDGYGPGGGATNPNSSWTDVSKIKSRMQDGVVGLMEAYPTSSWTSTIATIHSQTPTTCAPKNKFTLSVTSGTGGSVAVVPAGTSFDSGTSVKLKATPQPGFVFGGWSGAVTGSKDTITVVMNSLKNISASFAHVFPKYNLIITGSFGGSIKVNPAGASFDSGTSVGLKAKPNVGYSFTSWGGSVAGVTDSATLVMNSDKNVSVTFTKSIAVLAVDRRFDKIRLHGDQLTVSLGKTGPVRFALISLDGRMLQDLGSIQMAGQEQIFGLEHRSPGLAYLHMRGEGWEMVVPLNSAR